MSLRTISIQGFRNLADNELSFSPRFNFFSGNNGAGKTNLLEAIHVAGTASSFRVREHKIMIKDDASYFRVGASTDTTTASIYCDKTRKKLSLQGNDVKRLSAYVGWLGITMLSIEDLWIVRGAPAQRRAFYDWLIAKVAPRYLDDTMEYRKLIGQRNRILQTIGSNGNHQVLDAYTDQYITVANRIYQERKRFLPVLRSSIMDLGTKLGLHDFAIEYHSTCANMELDHSQVEQVYDKEVQYGRTIIGPHRDDLHLFMKNHPLQHFASEGQERAVAISLKLAEASIIEQQTGEHPILLMDEASGELDDIRKNILLELPKGQVFYASTRIPSSLKDLNDDHKFFTIRGGIVEASEAH
jgi:DNA replication and repair protein RecF